MMEALPSFSTTEDPLSSSTTHCRSLNLVIMQEQFKSCPKHAIPSIVSMKWPENFPGQAGLIVWKKNRCT
jgi:hypothetical protein